MAKRQPKNTEPRYTPEEFKEILEYTARFFEEEAAKDRETVDRGEFYAEGNESVAKKFRFVAKENLQIWAESWEAERKKAATPKGGDQ